MEWDNTLSRCSRIPDGLKPEKPKEKLCEITIRNKIITVRAILMAFKSNPNILLEMKSLDDLETIFRNKTSITLNDLKSCMIANVDKKSFESCLNITKNNSYVSYESFRALIYKLYLNHKVPTKQDIVNHMEITEERFNVVLKENGFVLKRIGETFKALIVEEPSQVYKRIMYLNMVTNLRILNRIFVYITYKDDTFSLVVSPCAEVLRFKSYMNSDGEETERAYSFIESVIPLLPASSVVILDSNDLLEPKPAPNQYSSKKQMQEWLMRQDISFAEDAHTAELYALIQKFGDKTRGSCKIQDLLETRGFVVLRVPKELSSLSYLKPIYDQIKGLPYMTEAEYMRSIFSKYGNKELRALEDTLKKEEIQVYCDDLRVEKIVETIRLASTRLVILPSDLRSCSIYDPEAVPSYIVLD